MPYSRNIMSCVAYLSLLPAPVAPRFSQLWYFCHLTLRGGDRREVNRVWKTKNSELRLCVYHTT
jgi:hypothetical protein